MKPTPSALVLSGLVLCAWSQPAVARQSAPAGQHRTPPTMDDVRRLHADPAAYIASLDNPSRDAYQKPHEVVAAMGLKDGERIADIGAGSGYFALRFARHVGPGGRVYAVDVSPDMILHLNRQVRQAGLDNVRTILSGPDDPLLPDASVDRVFICNTWHHIGGHAAYLGLLRKVLRPGGQVVIVDFQKHGPVGPPPEMRAERADVVKEFEAEGYALVKEHTFLPAQYFLVFAPRTGR